MSSQVGTGVFSQEMPSHIGKPFFLSGNAVPHREAIFSTGKCRPEPGGRFFRPEMPSRIGRPFFPPGGVVPNRDAVFSLSLRAALLLRSFQRFAAGLKTRVNSLYFLAYLIFAFSSIIYLCSFICYLLSFSLSCPDVIDLLYIHHTRLCGSK